MQERACTGHGPRAMHRARHNGTSTTLVSGGDGREWGGGGGLWQCLVRWSPSGTVWRAPVRLGRAASNRRLNLFGANHNFKNETKPNQKRETIAPWHYKSCMQSFCCHSFASKMEIAASRSAPAIRPCVVSSRTARAGQGTVASLCTRGLGTLRVGLGAVQRTTNLLHHHLVNIEQTVRRMVEGQIKHITHLAEETANAHNKEIFVATGRQLVLAHIPDNGLEPDRLVPTVADKDFEP